MKKIDAARGLNSNDRYFIGTRNDAPCFSAAAAMLGRAWTMVRANQMSVTLGAGSAAMVSP